MNQTKKLCMGLSLLILCACASSMSQNHANEFAARLANEECFKLFGEKPFKPSDYDAMFEGGRWQWGALERGGIQGYSAVITFLKDGSQPRARVSLSANSPVPRSHQRGVLEGRRQMNYDKEDANTNSPEGK